YIDEMQVPTRVALSRCIAASCTSPNEPVSLPSGSKQFWNHRWKHALPKNGSYEWSLWESILHYATHLTEFSGEEFYDFINIGLPESFCDIIYSLVDEGADV